MAWGRRIVKTTVQGYKASLPQTITGNRDISVMTGDIEIHTTPDQVSNGYRQALGKARVCRKQTKASPEKPLSADDYVDLGFVSASVTWRMKIPSSGCSVSSISYIYDDAIASVVPSLLKAREAILVGYRWN